MSISEQIDVILASRKNKAEEMKRRKEALAGLRTLLKQSCDEFYSRAENIEDEKLRNQYQDIMDEIDVTPVLTSIDKASKKLDEGVKRFQRDYISIATIGKEGQGKSRLLQAIGDLNGDIIPSGDAGSCTGATSIIWNDPSLPQGSVRCRISFRQPEDLVELVKPYIATLDPTYLESRELDFDSIGGINVNRLAGKRGGDANDARRSNAARHLKKIVDNFPEIRDLFGSNPITLTDQKKIQSFVAQNNGLPESDPDCQQFYSYLAVARADIYCPFYTDTGKIRLVDTVGIGATQYGIEDAMLNTVDNECDAAIVMCKPDGRGVQEPDVELYTSLRTRFINRDTSKWLFYFVNHHRGRNDNSVELFRDTVLEEKWAVADCRVIDASNQDTVRDEFMIPALEILIRNMEEIDQAYLQEILEFEKNVHKQLRRFLDESPVLKPIESQQGKEAFDKGEQCFNRLSADLSEQVIYWSDKREEANSALWNCIQAILNNMDDIIPTAEQIQKISDRNGALLGEGIWESVLHHVRNVITDKFIAIDNVLEQETLQFKNSLVKHLYHELRLLSADQEDFADEDAENVDMVKWLKTMLDDVLGNTPEYAQISKAFQFLYKFEFNTRAQVIQEVRRQLYIINPICDEYAKPTVTFKKANCGEQVHFYLVSRMSLIEDELRYHLAKLYRTPNQAFYAAAEEFYDRLTFASDLDGTKLTNMSNIWGKFFQSFSTTLWKNDLQRHQKVNELIAAYNMMKAQLETFMASAS